MTERPLPAGPASPRALAGRRCPTGWSSRRFERTGGLHATGLFDADGELLITREDVGRHNAMDKVIGRALLDGLVPLRRARCCASAAGCRSSSCRRRPWPERRSWSASARPSSLAISLAEDRGLTLCGFARAGRVNVYTHPQRIVG